MGYAIYGIMCILLGGVTGAFIGAKFARRRKEAPCPVDLSAVEQNAIGARLNAPRRVVINGTVWTVYGGQQWERQ